MKKLLLVLSLSLPFIGYAQTEGSVFTATGRGGVATTFVRQYQSLGINVGNLNIQGKDEKIVGFALLEVGASAWSDALKKKELRQAMFRTSDKFTKEAKQAAAEAFVNKGVAFDLDIMTFGIGVNVPKVGGFAFSSRERISSYIRLDEFASNLLFEGFNYEDYFDSTFLDIEGIDTTGLAAATLAGDTAKVAMILENAILTGTSSIAKSFGELMKNTRITFIWTREYNFGYGREIYAWNDVSLYGGVGIKFIQGFGIIDMDLSSSKPGGYLAVSPVVPIDFSDIDTILEYLPFGKEEALSWVNSFPNNSMNKRSLILHSNNLQYRSIYRKIAWGMLIHLVSVNKIKSKTYYLTKAEVIDYWKLYRGNRTEEDITKTIP